MLSSKMDNKTVRQMYRGKTYIETKITLYTEVNEDLKKKFYDRMDLIEEIMSDINKKVECIVVDNFEENSDIAEIISAVRGKLNS